VLAIAGLGGKYAMKEMLLAQQQASDQWAYYQAKVVREHLNRGNKILTEAQLAEPSGLKGAERAKFEKLAARFADEEKRMVGDKKDIEKVAHKLEHERDLYRTKDPYFDYAEVLLQIAIVCSSVAILAASRPMVILSRRSCRGRRAHDDQRLSARRTDPVPAAPLITWGAPTWPPIPPKRSERPGGPGALLV